MPSDPARIFEESVNEPFYHARYTRYRVGGAGVAGLTATVVLARAGEDVEVLEIKSRVGSSAGGHTEGIRNYLGLDGLEDLSRFGVKVRPFSVANRVVRRSPRFVSVVRGLSYYLVDRGGDPNSLEKQLLEQALEAGAKVRYKTKADPDSVDILATGAPRNRVNIFAAGYRFTHAGSKLPDDEIHAAFDNDIAPHGYLCVLPGPKWHSLYTVSWQALPYGELIAKVDRALRLRWVREVLGTATIVGKIFGKSYYDADPYAAAKEDGVLRVGEAGGIQDSVGGFGIRYAVGSGALAARALLDGSDYSSLLRQEFPDDFEIAMKSRAWLDRATNEDYDEILQKLGPEVGVADYAAWRRVRFL